MENKKPIAVAVWVEDDDLYSKDLFTEQDIEEYTSDDWEYKVIIVRGDNLDTIVNT